MKKYSQFLSEDRRLCILKILQAAPQYTCNHYLLQAALVPFGHNVSKQVICEDIDFLADCQAVTKEADVELHICKLTSLGDEIARGLLIMDGIKRPLPE